MHENESPFTVGPCGRRAGVLTGIGDQYSCV